MGLDASIEGEQGDAGNDYASGDKINLNLPGEQEQILKLCLTVANLLFCFFYLVVHLP